MTVVGIDLSMFSSDQKGVRVVAERLFPLLTTELVARGVRCVIRAQSAEFEHLRTLVGDFVEADVRWVVSRAGQSRLAQFLDQQVKGRSDFADCDVVWAPDYSVPLFLSSPVVPTVHDLNYRSNPGSFSRAGRLLRAVLVPVILLRARAVITVSQASRAELLAFRPGLADRVIVVANATGLDRDGALQPIPGAPPRFILGVGTQKPHKRFDVLLHALAATDDAVLVLAGRQGEATAELAELHDQLGLAGRVFWAGEVKDAELRWLYETATGVASTSGYEGYGLPAVEAAAFGHRPVLTDIPAFKELGLAASWIPVGDVAATSVALTRLWSSNKRAGVGDGLPSWSDRAHELATVLSMLAHGGAA